MKRNYISSDRFFFTFLVCLLFSGYGTRSQADSVFREDYQTPELNLSQYQSPELRGGAQNKNLSVVVAISGGGHRAGNFGIGVLSALEEITCGDERHNALKEIDYFSTVSGGGFTAATYIATLYDHISKHKDSTNYSLKKLLSVKDSPVRRNLERGYHNKLAKVFIMLRSIGNLDRGDFLEKAFDQKILGAENRGGTSLVLGDIFVKKGLSTTTPTLPMWIANSTIYENGSIFAAYPLSFQEYKITGYTHNTKEQKITNENDIYKIPLSVGLIASASFPGAVPATTLISSYDTQNPYVHLFDGGLADNLGVTTALEILAGTGENKKVLIVIDAYKGQREPFSPKEGSPTILEIFNRSTGISLDARRIRHKLELNQISSSDIFNGQNVEVIFLSFDDLPKDTREKARDITTDFNISEEEQEILLRAGEEIVEINKAQLIRAIFADECKGDS